MELLKMLSDRHDDWIRMASSLHVRNDEVLGTPNDIVQDMYVRLNKYVNDPSKIMYNDTELNTMFIYITIRNIYFNHYRYQSKTNLVTSDKEYFQDDTCTQSDLDHSVELFKIELEDKILEEIKTWHHYNARIFKIIFFEGVGLRKLARDSGISLSSIFNTVKKGKKKLRDKFGDDYLVYQQILRDEKENK